MSANAIRVEPLKSNMFEAAAPAFLAIAADVPGEYWTHEHFRRDLPLKWDLSLAAWDAARPVGYAIVSAKAHSTAHLHHLMLAPDQRGGGLGRRLLEAAISRAKAHGRTHFTLKVAAGNPAHRFYSRAGFTICSEENGYLVLTRPI